MATRPPDKTTPLAIKGITRWTGLTAGAEGAAVEVPAFAERSVQVSGEFGGASLVIEGSIDGKDFAVLSDAQGLDCEFFGSVLKAPVEPACWIRPRVSGGDATTKLTVHLAARRAV